MFSGIVEGTACVICVEKKGEGKEILLSFPKRLRDVKVGDSISVNGVCLTVTSKREKKNQTIMKFDLSPETLSRSNLKFIKEGDFVNFERALRLNQGISGHLVQGHVLSTLKIVEISRKNQESEFLRFGFEIKPEIRKYVIEKSFVAIDGISLTVSEIKDESVFFVDIIPTTLKLTNLRFRKEGDEVNFEPDIIVKTVVDTLERGLVQVGKK